MKNSYMTDKDDSSDVTLNNLLDAFTFFSKVSALPLAPFNEEPPKYCGRCGEELNVYSPRIRSYNTSSGAINSVKYRLSCPNDRFYKIASHTDCDVILYIAKNVTIDEANYKYIMILDRGYTLA